MLEKTQEKKENQTLCLKYRYVTIGMMGKSHRKKDYSKKNFRSSKHESSVVALVQFPNALPYNLVGSMGTLRAKSAFQIEISGIQP